MNKTPLSVRIQNTSKLLHWTLIVGIISLAGLSLNNYTKDKSLSAKIQELQTNRNQLHDNTISLEQEILQIKAFKQINKKSQINAMQKNKKNIFLESRKDRLSLLKK